MLRTRNFIMFPDAAYHLPYKLGVSQLFLLRRELPHFVYTGGMRPAGDSKEPL